MKTQQDVIKMFMESLDKTNSSGVTALNEAIKYCSGSKYTTIQAVVNQMISDCNSNSSSTFLKDYCGINLNNSDTGAITGSDAGGSVVKTAESIVPETANFVAYTGKSFTTNGLTFTLNKNFNSLDNI